MVKRIGGARRKTKHRLTKGYRRKGKISISRFFQKFEKGQKVTVQPEPSYQKSLCHKRYFGKSAVINKKQGSCYEIDFLVNKRTRKVIIHPIHLVKVK